MKHKIQRLGERLWRRASRHWQTGVLLASVALGYLLFLGATGFRPIAWLLGSAVALAMLLAWLAQFRPNPMGGKRPPAQPVGSEPSKIEPFEKDL